MTMLRTNFPAAGAAFILLAGAALSQPALDPEWTLAEIPCTVDTSAVAQLDTVPTVHWTQSDDPNLWGPDSNGFYSIFDGRSSRGWWQNCRTPHSNNNASGAIFRIDTVRKAIYTMQRSTSIGGLLATKKKYAHYEIVFDWWPQYGNDGGVFNRMTLTGRSNQTVLDYLNASAILGAWSENGFPSRELGGGSGTRNYRPWTYNGSATPFTTGPNGATTPSSGGDTIVQIPGSGGNGGSSSNWSTQTNSSNPEAAGIGCAASGCVQADLRRLWNKNGWNQGRIVYFGGLSTNQPASRSQPGDKIRMYTYTRIYYPKTNPDGPYSPPIPGVSDTARWVPVLRDSIVLTANEALQNPASWIGLQVHNGSRFVHLGQQGRGTWFRNIRIRELDSLGNPLYIPSAIKPAGDRKVTYDMRVAGGVIEGNMDLDHSVFIRDLQGRLIERRNGDAGRNLRYELPRHQGVMLVQIRSSRGTQTFRVNGLQF